MSELTVSIRVNTAYYSHPHLSGNDNHVSLSLPTEAGSWVFVEFANVSLFLSFYEGLKRFIDEHGLDNERMETRNDD